MIYGEHVSRGREFLGVVTVDAGVGGVSGVDVTCGWRGMVRVEDERNEVAGFAKGVSAEEATNERDSRHHEVEGRGWTARWEGGGMKWRV